MRILARLAIAAGVVILVIIGGIALYRRMGTSRGGGSPRDAKVLEWIRSPASHPDWSVRAGEACGTAPFKMPTSGFIGYLWADTFQPGHPHQGIDVFGGGQPGETPVYAAYPGYLTRLPDWKSTVIVRIPSDPLQPGRQIWAYYTHMADAQGNSLVAADFPPGTSEVFIPAGRLLGRQGNYSGDPGSPVGVHLHFSLVQDDGKGHIRNELQIENTLDPSPYLGLMLNADRAGDEPAVCPAA